MSQAFSTIHWPEPNPTNKTISMYEEAIHRKQLENWYNHWGWDTRILDLMPETGLIIDGICAIFLYETNANVCFVEGFISNPEIDDECRKAALEDICGECLKLAKSKGYTHMMGYTKLPVVEKRVTRFGFNVGTETYRCFYRSL